MRVNRTSWAIAFAIMSSMALVVGGNAQAATSIFVGDYSPQAAGDYASGPNHVLPTSGQARFRGGLSVLDFVKLVTVQKLSPSGLQRIARTVECLAEIEGLQGHAESIRTRCANA